MVLRAQFPGGVDQRVNIFRRRVDRQRATQAENITFGVAGALLEALPSVGPDIARAAVRHCRGRPDIADEPHPVSNLGARGGQIDLVDT